MFKRALEILLAVFFTLSVPTIIFAQEQGSASIGKESSLLGLMLRLILSLVLIVGLIYGVLYVLKRSMHHTKTSLGKNIEVLERSFISPKKGIFVVKVQSKVLVLGVTETNINCLTELGGIPEDKTNPSLDKVVKKKKNFLDFLQEAKSKISLPFMRNKDAMECN
jgi:flagellar biosynthetic protein FliO